jgi:hypothetical protein
MKYRINLIEQSRRFWGMMRDGSVELRSSSITIYLYLLDVNNECGWKEWFTIQQNVALKATGIGSNRTYYKALQELREKGFIKYVPGLNNFKSALINIIKIEKNAPLHAHQSAQLTAQQYAQLTALLTAHIHNKDIIIKINEIINNNPVNSDNEKHKREKENPENKNAKKINEENSGAHEKIKYGEFVEMTEAEYNRLELSFGIDKAKRLIEILDNYKGSSGKKYKSDYRAILNWCVKRLKEDEEKPLKNYNNGRNNNNDEPLSESIKRAFEKIDELSGAK